MIDNEFKFEQVYASFQSKIHRYLTQMVGNREAEDLTQEVFIKVGKALADFRKEAQLSTWIYRIATNAAIDKMRDSSFRRESPEKQLKCSFITSDHIEIEKEEAGLSAQTFSLEEQVIHGEMNDCIRRIVENLPKNYRVVVILSELEGLKNKEISEILGVSLDVVKVSLHRGRARLKKELLNYCYVTAVPVDNGG